MDDNGKDMQASCMCRKRPFWGLDWWTPDGGGVRDHLSHSDRNSPYAMLQILRDEKGINNRSEHEDVIWGELCKCIRAGT